MTPDESRSVSKQQDPDRGGGLVPWPPPDLSRIQGEIWRMIGVAGLGSLILVLPLLWEVAAERAFWSLGPFGESWEVPLTTTGIGLLLLLAAFRSLFRLLRRSAAAADAGYGRLTILQVSSDASRDTGFLLQGARQYSEMDPATRRRIVRCRILGSLAYLGAALWVPVGFSLGVLAAARGMGSGATIWLAALAPAGLFAFVGMQLRILEQGAVKTARDRWIRKTGLVAWLQEEVQDWVGKLGPVADELALDPGEGERGLTLRVMAISVVVLFVLISVPVVSLAFTTALGPRVADLAVPAFEEIREDAAGTEALRRYVVAPDPGITPTEAGEALQALLYVGSEGGGQRAFVTPVRRYGEPWFPVGDEVGPIYPAFWVLDVLDRARGGLSPAERGYLERLASHPAQPELAILARASRGDVVGTRWRLPFPDTLTLLSLPVPRFGAVRDAGHARIGKAAWELSRGRLEEAEESLREVISSGFFLVEEGPLLTDALVGMALIETGANALERFYRASGKPLDAEGLEWARSSASRAAQLARVEAEFQDIQAQVRGMSDVVLREAAPRGLRWDLLGGFHTLSPCINTHKVVFGPGPDYDVWLAEARAGLVRFSSEEEFFRLARGGWLGSGGGAEAPGWMTRVLVLSLGGQRVLGSCTTLLAGMQ